MRILEKIVSQALSQTPPTGEAKTTVVHLHLSQMSEWGVRGGNIQLKAIQDFNNIRKAFINQVLKESRIKQRLDHLMDSLVCRGEILWLLEPSQTNPTGYQLDYYVGGKFNPNPDYYIYYSTYQRGAIDCAVIKTWHRKGMNYGSETSLVLPSKLSAIDLKQWYLIFIDRERILRFKLDNEPQNLDSYYHLYSGYKNGQPSLYNNLSPEEFPNPFAPDFPFAISKNIEARLDEPGIDDFSPVEDLIQEHNDLLLAASENLYTFNTPTLITSREASTVLETVKRDNESDLILNSWAGQNNYRSTLRPPNQADYRMPKVIGNIREGERFGYVQPPDAVSGDQNLYIRQLRELIHWVLGGIDPLGISASATFGEIKSLFGRIENTSMKKAESLLGENGLCKLISIILRTEENKCKLAMTRYIISHYLLTNVSDEDLELNDKTFRDLYFYLTEEIKLKLPGLPPLGSRACSWRYTKDVFQMTTREMLDKSIVYRNEREDGFSQEIALPKLYPNMPDEEIRQAMSGFSPRVVQAGLEGISASLQIYQQFSQMADPEDPTGKRSWESRLNTYKLVEQAMLTLQKEITFNQPDFRENANYDNLNEELTSVITRIRQKQSQHLTDVRPTTTTNTVPATTPYATIPNGTTPTNGYGRASQQADRPDRKGQSAP